MSEQADDAPWPVDLEGFRLWQLEGEDGPLLQELFDGLPDFSTTFGERGAADAVSTYISLPEGADYNDKLLPGLWHNGTLIGALDCITGYPTRSEWTVDMLVVAGRHRSRGYGSAALSWLERTAVGPDAGQLRPCETLSSR
ncbi:MAG: hypothetical protein AVDCRST_MAG75-1231 [uncultured Propionibacteriaceae bacterium]|uniref:N-acetyltransferase domain-containing protein n=1 Tax=uncultured Propionibacteriaceae bacterium TaxID=257457 RepID=A0A6J4NDW1_9ACTN|nr:MAG: hypothetical protein AVDCRST_MAG75-1231 [uncultured Propionibacteriaceae bacterium]